jgi:hypothetical protein
VALGIGHHDNGALVVVVSSGIAATAKVDPAQLRSRPPHKALTRFRFAWAGSCMRCAAVAI